MALNVTVLSNIPNLLKELAKAIPSVNFHQVLEPDKKSDLKKSEILICDFDLLGPHLYSLPNAKWVQGTWAGIDKLMPHVEKCNPPPYLITRFTGEHFGKMMAEYMVANIVNHERNLLQVYMNQKKTQWNQDGKIQNYRTILDLTVGILGIGNIGNRVGQILHILGAKVLAFGNKRVLPQDREFSYVKKYYIKETLPLLLKECDYIINTLPRTNETNGLLNNDILANCTGKENVFINVGRSNIISEESLLKALENKWLSAAILDVFDVEPLPADSLLWNAEQVFITPHVSAVSRAKDIAAQFAVNLNLYQQKLPLPAVIDFIKGY